MTMAIVWTLFVTASLVCGAVYGTLADVTLFGAFLVWAVANFIAARRRDRVAGRTYPVRGGPRHAAVVGIGFAAWALFAFFGHAWLIGVSPFRVG